jgi:hypothetical protein
MECNQCKSSFDITDKDCEFYKKMEVPEPTLCPPCRQQRRMAWVNQIHLYKRTCDATGKQVITNYPPQNPCKVYEQSFFYSDQWDARGYGRDYDFNKPFFDQFNELSLAVPRPALMTTYTQSENSEYVNHAGFNKNCYMIFDADYNRDCLYDFGINHCKNTVDCHRSRNSELCYECIDVKDCFRLFYSQDCENCSDSAFLKNCIGVRNSFMCSNLKNKEYYIFNQAYDKATYEKLMQSLSSHESLKKYLKDWGAFKLKYPQKDQHGFQNINVVGDYLVNSKDSSYCFDSMELWDCKYFTRSFGNAKDSMDCDECGDNSELMYDCHICGFNMTHARFCLESVEQSHNLTHAYECRYSEHLFACISLLRKKYCILNKQYTKEEYEALVPKIIEHMKSTGEWGEFMPAKYSPFAYNESVAFEYYPLNKAEVESRGWRWREEDQKEHLAATANVPDNSAQADKSLCNCILACEECGRNYKIVEQELSFYQQNSLPIPKKCFYCRHQSRITQRNPRVMYNRTCDRCQKPIKTTYAPERPEIVYCEICYADSFE